MPQRQTLALIAVSIPRDDLGAWPPVESQLDESSPADLDSFTVIARGTTNVTNARLGQLDPSLSPALLLFSIAYAARQSTLRRAA